VSISNIIKQKNAGCPIISSFDKHFKIGIYGNINRIIGLFGIYELIKECSVLFLSGM